MKHHLDPPRFARWLREQGATTLTVGDVGTRTLWRWEHETERPIPFYGAADRILTRLEIHEWEIPDDLWVDPPTCRDCGVAVTGKMIYCHPCRGKVRSQRRREQRAKRAEANALIDAAFAGLVEISPGKWRRGVVA